MVSNGFPPGVGLGFATGCCMLSRFPLVSHGFPLGVCLVFAMDLCMVSHGFAIGFYIVSIGVPWFQWFPTGCLSWIRHGCWRFQRFRHSSSHSSSHGYPRFETVPGHQSQRGAGPRGGGFTSELLEFGSNETAGGGGGNASWRAVRIFWYRFLKSRVIGLSWFFKPAK